MSKTFAKSRCELFNEYHPRITQLDQYGSVVREVHDVESRIMKRMTLTIKDGKLARMQEHKERLATAKPNSIAVKQPELLENWDWDKNAALGLDPYQISTWSKEGAWWLCPIHGEAHRHFSIIRNKAQRPNNCAVCTGHQIVSGVNDLQSLAPELMEEWDWEKNAENGLDPSKIASRSGKKASWKCKAYGHRWDATIQSRFNKTGCPYCSNTKLLTGFNDLATTYPQLLDEWDYEANTIEPTQVMGGSQLKVSWICSTCGHHFDMAIADRTSRGSRCPTCGRNNAGLAKAAPTQGHTLADEYPDIASEWHPDKNGDKTPYDFKPHSNKSVWWLCDYGHEWQASINNRTGVNRRGCPKCSEYTRTSYPEKAIYYYVSQVYKDALSDSVVELDDGSSISLDIWIPSERVAIEYDGQFWHSNPKRDSAKDYQCFVNGIVLIRVREPNCAIYNDIVSTIRIERDDTHGAESLNAAINSVFDVLGCKDIVDVNTARDENAIRALMVENKIKNSFGENYPNAAKQWHPTKNGLLTPYMVSSHSSQQAWFICEKGHEYYTSVANRAKGCSCYICAMKECGRQKMVPSKGESLADKAPQACDAWHPTKNGDMTPWDIKPCSNKKFWWLCPECGGEYQSAPLKRTRNGQGNFLCRSCSLKRAGQRRREESGKRLLELVAQNNPNTEVIGEYVSDKTKIKCRCKVCGNVWDAWPYNIKVGHGCANCAADKRGEMLHKRALEQKHNAT